MHLYIGSQILQMLEHSRKLVIHNRLLTLLDNWYSDVVDELQLITGSKNAFPQSDSIEKFEVLGIEESHPSETVEKWVNFELVHLLPDFRF